MASWQSRFDTIAGRWALTSAGCTGLTVLGVAGSPSTGRPVVDLAAGVALVAAWRWGLWLLLPAGLGVALGWQLWLQTQNSYAGGISATWIDALILGAASVVRACLGVWWMPNRGAARPALDEPREVASFFWRAAVLPSFAATTVAMVCGVGFGALKISDVWLIGTSHWASGAFGTLLGTTLLFAWLGQPRDDWAPRRGPLTLVIVIGVALILVVAEVIARAEHHRRTSELGRAAAASGHQLRAQLLSAQHALSAIRYLFIHDREVTREEFRLAAEPWLQSPSQLLALGWSEVLAPEDIARFETRAHAEGMANLRVMSADGKGGVRPVRPGEPMAVIRFIEPLAQNRLAPGINSRANPVAAVAIDKALAGGGMTATSGFPLRLPPPAQGPEPGVVLYEAVDTPRRSAPGRPADRGLVFATIRVTQLWQAVLASRAADIALCLYELDGNTPVRLAADEGVCAQPPPPSPEPAGNGAGRPHDVLGAALSVALPVTFGNQQWIMVAHDAGASRQRTVLAVTVLVLAGFAGVTVLVGLLLVITGRARRIQRAVAEAQAARKAADDASRAKSHFLSQMSHDLRTPLNAVVGFAQLIETEDDHRVSPECRRWARHIHQAGGYLLEMIGEILDLARIEAGGLRLRAGAVDVRRAVDDAVTLVAGAAHARGVRVGVRVDEDIVSVRGDPTRVRQILVNLLSNAVKYNKQDGWAEMHARCDGENVRIDVRDGGVGMGVEQVEQLFQPFNRLGREGSAIEGTGIGLVISRRLAQAMGGDIEVQSRRDEGSTFTLVLPASAECETVAAGAGGPPAGGRPEDMVRALRVHYVEDDHVNQELVRAMLARHGDVDVHCSSTGAEELRLLRGGAAQPDLILLDLNLPDCDGAELLKLLRADPATARLPMVVLSADVTAEAQARALHAGADECLGKPAELGALMAVVRRHDHRRQPATAPESL